MHLFPAFGTDELMVVTWVHAGDGCCLVRVRKGRTPPRRDRGRLCPVANPGSRPVPGARCEVQPPGSRLENRSAFARRGGRFALHQGRPRIRQPYEASPCVGQCSFPETSPTGRSRQRGHGGGARGTCQAIGRAEPGDGTRLSPMASSAEAPTMAARASAAVAKQGRAASIPPAAKARSTVRVWLTTTSVMPR